MNGIYLECLTRKCPYAEGNFDNGFKCTIPESISEDCPFAEVYD